MARKVKKVDIGDASFDITPLIDCVFLLLIFFMVTSVFKNPARLKMELPFAENPQVLDKRQLVAELDAEGNVALNGTMASFDSFDAYLVSEKQKIVGIITKSDILTLMK